MMSLKAFLLPIPTKRLSIILIGIALAAFAARAAPIVARSDVGRAMEPNGDSAAYIGLANGLKRGCGFTWWAGNHCGAAPETNRTPGYPVFLALMPGLRTALIAQALLSSLLCFLVGLFTGTYVGDRAGYCAAGIIAVDLPSIVSSNEIMSETLFTALLVGAVLAELEMLRSPASAAKLYCLLASAMLGLALLVRPIAEFVIPLVLLAPMFLEGSSWSRRALLSILVATGPAICGVTWILRNHLIAGVNSFSTIGGLNFFYYRAVGTLALASGSGWVETLAGSHALPKTDLSVQAWHIILHHPFAFIAMTLWSFVYLCLVPDRTPLAHLLGITSVVPIQDPGSVRIEALVHNLWVGNFAGLGTISSRELYSSLVLLLLVAFQLVTIGFTWTGVILALKKSIHHPPRACVLLAFAVAVLILLPAAGPEAVARFRIPAMPLLAFVAGVGWFEITGDGSRRLNANGSAGGSDGRLSALALLQCGGLKLWPPITSVESFTTL
jgi:hypothetical protein